MCFGLWKWKGSAVMASLSTVNLMINYTYIYIYIYIILFVPNIFRTWSLFKWVSCSLVSAAEMYSTWFGRSFQSAAFNQRLVVWIPREFRMQGMVTYRKHTPRIPKQQPKTPVNDCLKFGDFAIHFVSFNFIQYILFNMFHSISSSPTVDPTREDKFARSFFSISAPTLKPIGSMVLVYMLT